MTKMETIELESVNGGGWFDDIVDFCVEAVKNATVYPTSEFTWAVEMMLDEGIRRLSDSMYDAMEKVAHPTP